MAGSFAITYKTGRATKDKTLKIKHRNGIDKYKTYFQAERIIASFDLKSTRILIKCDKNLILVGFSDFIHNKQSKSTKFVHKNKLFVFVVIVF